MVRKLIIRIGLFKSVLAAMALATASSVAFTYAVMSFKQGGMSEIALTISALAPLTIAPFLFWPLFSAFIKIHHLEQDMRRLAMLDELTGIMNRRAFLDHAEQAINLAGRNRIELALVYIDLDDFKHINDVHGHTKGDEVLRCFAQAARKIVRKSDVIGRLGGEEFAMIVYGAGKDAVRQIVEKLLDEIRNVVVSASGKQIRITASVGITHLQAEDCVSVDQMIARADKALYLAKRAGKDRFAFCE